MPFNNCRLAQQPPSGLKNVLKKPHEAFQGFQQQIYRTSCKSDADTLLDFAIHRRKNETQSQKSTHVKTMHIHSTSHGRLMQ
jgi:hypothetical protein